MAQLKKGHVQSWIEAHDTWVSSATRGSVISIIMAAFNRAEELFAIPNPLKGLKKPKAEPRLQSFTPDEEQILYGNLEPIFQNFLFAAIHTGLRPFCELAKMTADDIEETPRGMMWHVYSSKTEKTRKIPFRPEVAELTRQLMKTHRMVPTGQSFATPRGSLAADDRRGAVPLTQEETRLGSGSRQRPLLLLHLPTHIRASDALGVLDQERRLSHRDAGRVDRRYPQNRV